MIERIVENWLSNTNERGYEIPFCQYLISSGYTILELSFHGQIEQGKDIIAIDENGTPCAYQLKSGVIDQKEWNKIKAEIDTLVEIPIKYPKVDNRINHRCILVTNGRITSKVRVDIADRNENFKRRGLPELEIIEGHELLKKFIDIHGRFLPAAVPDLRAFLELFVLDGRELINKEVFTKFLEKLFLGEYQNKRQLSRRVASAILLTQYIIEPYEKEENHLSIVEGWTCFYCYVLAIVEKYGLKTSAYVPSLSIILDKINFQLQSLKKEFLDRTNFIEGLYDGGLFYKSRLTITLGWLSAFELYKKCSDANYVIDLRVYNRIKQYYNAVTWYWGESATPLFVMMSKLAKQAGDLALSYRILCESIIDITFKNNPREKEALPDPYYSVNAVLNHRYGPPEGRIDMSSFAGASYHLASLVDLLVRQGQEKLLGEMWKPISYILNSEIRELSKWETFRWHCDESGEQNDGFYDCPQSWHTLKESACRIEKQLFPQTLVDNPFLYYFLNCYPHRFNRDTAKLMDLLEKDNSLFSTDT